VRDDWPLDDLGFGSQELRQVLPHKIRGQTHRLVSAGLVAERPKDELAAEDIRAR
jgi:hypothetical protein